MVCFKWVSWVRGWVALLIYQECIKKDVGQGVPYAYEVTCRGGTVVPYAYAYEVT